MRESEEIHARKLAKSRFAAYPEAMSFLIQSSVPYSEHFGWELSRQAYASAGLATWLDGPMPYQITGNISFALQQARVLLASLEHLPSNRLQTINVLELGAGTGLFAWHFIQAFTQLCHQANKPFRLRYLLTDPVRENLETLSQNPYFQPLIAAGTLDLAWADLEDVTLFSLDQLPLPVPELHLLTLSYVLGHQPFHLLEARDGQEHEYLISSQIESSTSFEALLADSSPLDELIFETESLVSHLYFEPDKRRRILLESLLNRWPERKMMYARDAFMGLCAWSKHLAPNGIMLISDKAWVDTERSPAYPEPSRHGPHLVWPAHYPLLAAWLNCHGMKTLHTHNPLWPLHTLMAVKGAVSEQLLKSFTHEFELHNRNLYAAELADSAEQATDSGDLRKAALLLTQALEYRPSDARLQHRLIACLIEQQAFDQAEAALNQPVIDLFNEYDFAFQRGQVALFKSDYSQACLQFAKSMLQAGSDPATHYNLGLSLMMAQQPEKAKIQFQAALVLDPEHQLAQMALKSWQESFGD